ncbi:sulfite exporter TauE/SafE family protein [Acidovorax sp.]|uniref:sulfite exporter TauE/SafE family protein n=1 Tax=Acidovorax sp. TaxID=1872122 RepID=UPI002ACD5A07|nr:sulfite exporter TauE/SafE family protein [Acidovorax sp.]MDZ7863617.1 sulfite exporter TauE/SafE family protein [Acidovorax sp.]
MLATLGWTALLMGLAGGPHCLAMCAAPCGALVGQGGEQPVRWAGPGGAGLAVAPAAPSFSWARSIAFHGGRVAGYAGLGAAAATAMDSLAWLTQRTAALQPAWTFLHLAIMAWGLLLLVQARQPAWVEGLGRSVWQRVRPLTAGAGGVGAAGLLWALMPCGLLYSALLVAALSGGPVQGGATMALFALGSGLWLVSGPWLWSRLRSRLNQTRADWGTRVAGGLLCAAAGWALWMDLVYKPSLWCR